MVRVPNNNTQCYKILYVLENTLRHFVEEKLIMEAKVKGLSGWFDLIPKKIRISWEKRVNKENSSYINFPKQKLLDYSNFTDLRRLIELHNDIFNSIKNCDALILKLKELEFIRNRIAHNRKIGDSELRRMENYKHDIFMIIRD